MIKNSCLFSAFFQILCSFFLIKNPDFPIQKILSANKFGIVENSTKFFNHQEISFPVLMYHSISNNPNNPLCISPDEFEKQLSILLMEGFTPITASELLSSWENDKPLPNKPVIITFDDGYEDNFQNAFSILRKYNAKATIFVTTNFINTMNYLTWEQLEIMEKSGLIDIESHSVHHFDLQKINDQQLIKELINSKAVLEKRLNKKITIFCYPSGKYSTNITNKLKETGYKMAFTIQPGLSNLNQGLFTLHRIRMLPHKIYDHFN